MTLSACCLTNQPGPQVATCLGLLRPLADEIVIAADARVDAETLGHYASVADVVVRVEYEPPFERYLAWLHGLCRGDWILRLDGDEVPSQSLLDALPDLIGRRDVLQFHLQKRWLFPDLGHWIDEWPWRPDYSTRLVRNDPGLWFPGLLHSGAAPAFPSEFLEASIYHLDTALSTRAERAAKVAAYLATPPGLTAPSANDLTATYYLPEDHVRLEPVEVPPADGVLIDAVTSARSVPAGDRCARPAVVTVDEVNRTWAGRPLSPDTYRATITPADSHRSLVAGEHRPFRVLVENGGDEQWPGGDRDPLIRVAYRWLTPAGTMVGPEGFRTPFPSTVAPGATCVVAAVVAAPPAPGNYVLEFDVVHEHVRWFDCGTRLAMTVRDGGGASAP